MISCLLFIHFSRWNQVNQLDVTLLACGLLVQSLKFGITASQPLSSWFSGARNKYIFGPVGWSGEDIMMIRVVDHNCSVPCFVIYFLFKWDHNWKKKWTSCSVEEDLKLETEAHQKTAHWGNKSKEKKGHFLVSLHTARLLFETSGFSPPAGLLLLHFTDWNASSSPETLCSVKHSCPQTHSLMWFVMQAAAEGQIALTITLQFHSFVPGVFIQWPAENIPRLCQHRGFVTW